MICPRCKREITDEMSYCPDCGMKIEKCQVCHQPLMNGARFCSHCGSQVNPYLNKSQIGGFYQPLGEEIEPRYDSNNEAYQDYNYEKETYQDIEVNRNVNKKTVTIVTIVVALLMIVSYMYLYYGPSLQLNSDKEEQIVFNEMKIDSTLSLSSQIGNMNQGGEVFLNEDVIYICDDNGYIVQMDRKLENRKILVNEECDGLNVVDDMIYYMNKDHQLCSISTSGEDKKVILNKEIYYLVVKGDKAYYQSQGGDKERLYVYDLKTNEETRLNDRKTYNPNVLDDVIYYTSTDGIYKIGLDGKGEEKIIEGTVYNLIYQDAKLYYTLLQNKQVVCYDIASQKTEVIAENVAGLINLNQDYVFYQSYNAQVIRYDLKTKESVKVYTGKIDAGYLVGDKLILETASVYDDNYKIIVDFTGENQQRIFQSQDGNFI